MTLLADLDAFYVEHRRCGDLEGAVAETTVPLRCSVGLTSPAQWSASSIWC